MTLKQWSANSWIEQHKTNALEVQDWIKRADQSLRDAEAQGLSDDGKFLMAYNSILLLATAAMAAEGYRPDRRDSHHLRVLESLEYTIGLGKADLQVLDRYRRKRNRNMYEAGGEISTIEANDLVDRAKRYRAMEEKWFRQQHPMLWK